MASIKGAGAILNVASAVSGTALALSAATAAAPPVLTTAANTFANGDIGVVTGVVGMTQLNNRAFNMNPVTGTTASLKGVDATAYTTYVSGGTVQKYTMILVGQVTDIKGFDGQPPEIDVTNMQSLAHEFLIGLQDFGNVNVSLLLPSGGVDAGQQKLRALKESAVPWPFSITLSDGSVAAFMGLVKQFGFDGVKPDGAVVGNVTLRVTNAPVFFA